MDGYSFAGEDGDRRYPGREYAQYYPRRSGAPDEYDGYYGATDTSDDENLATRPSPPRRRRSRRAATPGGTHRREDPGYVPRRSRRGSRRRSYSASGLYYSEYDQESQHQRQRDADQNGASYYRGDAYALGERESYAGGLELIPHPRHYRYPSPPSEGSGSGPESYWGDRPDEPRRYRRKHHRRGGQYEVEDTYYTRGRSMNGSRRPKRHRSKLGTLMGVVGGFLLAAVLWYQIREEKRESEKTNSRDRGGGRRR